MITDTITDYLHAAGWTEGPHGLLPPWRNADPQKTGFGVFAAMYAQHGAERRLREAVAAARAAADGDSHDAEHDALMELLDALEPLARALQGSRQTGGTE